MKPAAHKLFAIVLCLSLFLAALSNVFAESGQAYDNSVITGFDTDYSKTIDTEYKYTLIELRKEFPSQITVRFGGNVFYHEDGTGSHIISHVTDYTNRTIVIRWKCLENYDDHKDAYHFVPDLAGYKIAGGLDLPMITVNVLGELPIPPLTYTQEELPYYLDLPPADKHIAKYALPSSYNKFADGEQLPQNLPPIRDQNPYGSCWAFAAIAALEADLIHDGNADIDIDLSELHLAYYTYHDFYDEKNCNTGDTINSDGVPYLDIGGNSFYGSQALVNMLGPVQESIVPYSLVKTESGGKNPDGYAPGLTEGRMGNAQVTGFYLINNDDDIKQAILDHGAVAVTYYDDSDYFSDTYNSYYYSSPHGFNHGVALVGWDDDFPSENFKSDKELPAGNGAWLVRNSWGENNYSHYGYFWLSYYDKSFYHVAFVIDAQPWRYDHVYSYDNNIDYGSESTASDSTVSQVFTIDGGEEIRAIGFYTNDPISGLRFSLSSGDTTVTTSPVDLPGRGSYTIPLSSSFVISDTADVNLEYNFNSDSDYWAAVEHDSQDIHYNKQSDGTYKYTISFISHTGSGMMIDGIPIGKDAKIKLFTVDTYDLVLPAELTIIESEAFSDDSSFKSVKLQDKVTTIGSKAFANCSNLTKIYIPRSTTSIAPDAFGGRTDITIIGYSGSEAETFARRNGLPFSPK